MRSPVTSLVTLLLIAAPAVADEGRIPLYAATVITEPGVYVVTRDFAAAAPISVQATDVTVDLGGHTLTSTGNSVVSVAPGGDRRVTIKNGTLVGGVIGVAASGGGHIVLEELRIRGSQSHGVNVAGVKYFEARRCRIQSVGTGIASSGGVQVLVDNVVADAAAGIIVVANVRARIERNAIDNIGLGSSTYALYAEGAGLLIQDNLVTGGGQATTGIGVTSSSTGAVIRGNVVTRVGAGGIGCAAARAVIEGNQVEGNGGCGLALGEPTTIYRNNTLLGNTQGSVCGSGMNAGGNIM